MDDLSLYQWLVLGLLSIIALCAVAVAYGLDRSLEAMTQRLEIALADLRQHVEETASEIRSLRKATENPPNDYRES